MLCELLHPHPTTDTVGIQNVAHFTVLLLGASEYQFTRANVIFTPVCVRLRNLLKCNLLHSKRQRFFSNEDVVNPKTPSCVIVLPVL